MHDFRAACRAVAQLVARLVWDQEAASSSLAGPTKILSAQTADSPRAIAQLVARLHGVQEVVGSSPTSPTNSDFLKIQSRYETLSHVVVRI